MSLIKLIKGEANSRYVLSLKIGIYVNFNIIQNVKVICIY